MRREALVGGIDRRGSKWRELRRKDPAQQQDDERRRASSFFGDFSLFPRRHSLGWFGPFGLDRGLFRQCFVCGSRQRLQRLRSIWSDQSETLLTPQVSKSRPHTHGLLAGWLARKRRRRFFPATITHPRRERRVQSSPNEVSSPSRQPATSGSAGQSVGDQQSLSPFRSTDRRVVRLASQPINLSNRRSPNYRSGMYAPPSTYLLTFLLPQPNTPTGAAAAAAAVKQGEKSIMTEFGELVLVLVRSDRFTCDTTPPLPCPAPPPPRQITPTRINTQHDTIHNRSTYQHQRATCTSPTGRQP